MQDSSTVHQLNDTRAILTPSLNFELKDVHPKFYEELGDFTGRTLVSTFAWAEPWGVWEMHPKGDELVLLLEGSTDFVLRVNGRDQRLRLGTPGSYIIVPKGVWHTAETTTACRALFLTPGEGTRNEASPTT
ncbi:MAG: hypothetical protein AAF648_07000 [Pseudomonadota bacterium]